MIASFQPQFPLRDAKLRSRLVSLSATRAALVVKEEEIIAHIEALNLHGFDLGATGRRRHIGVLNSSLMEFQAALEQSRAPLCRDWTWEKILADAIPTKREFIHSSVLARQWNISANLVADLIEGGFLKILQKDYQPKEARLVLRQSAAQFLNDRRLS